MGNPASAAAVSCEQEATTCVSSNPVVLAISGRSGPNSVPAGTRGGKSLGGNSRALSSRSDQVWVTRVVELRGAGLGHLEARDAGQQSN